ncbi:hypothetical protein GYB22_04760 [bacterium]|nr:hypothetical protein [bacterium]
MSKEIKFCKADWNQMKPDSKGRLCTHCDKSVVDMRGMTWEEILKLKREHKEFVCGAYNPEQADQMQRGAIFPGLRFGRKAMLALLSTGAFYANGQDLQFTPEIETDTIQKQKATEVDNAPKIVKVNEYNFQVLDSSTKKPIQFIIGRMMDAPGVAYSDINGFITLLVPDSILNPRVELKMGEVKDTLELDSNTKIVYFDMDRVKVTVRSHTVGMVIRQDHDKIETRKDILDNAQKVNSSD